MLGNFLDSLEGAERKLNSIKYTHPKKFKKFACLPFTSPIQKGTLGFSFYLNNRKWIVGDTCVWKMLF